MLISDLSSDVCSSDLDAAGRAAARTLRRMTVYAVEGLSVRFGERRVVEGLSFSVAAGECLALVGESGSGKSQACLAPFGPSPGTARRSHVPMGEPLIGPPDARPRPRTHTGRGAGRE